MRLKSLVVTVATVLVSVTSLMAQQRGGAQKMSCEDMAKRRTEVLKKEAKLDEKQEKAALDVYTKACKDMQEARKNENKESMDKIRKESREAINALLTPEQAKLWKEHQDQQRDKRKGKKK